jgi:hypothetical protein
MLRSIERGSSGDDFDSLFALKLLEKIKGAVRGPVIDDDNLIWSDCIMEYSFEAEFEKSAGIKIDSKYCGERGH